MKIKPIVPIIKSIISNTNIFLYEYLFPNLFVTGKNSPATPNKIRVVTVK